MYGQPLVKGGIRILTPFESDRLLAAITKNDSRAIFKHALYTGMRFVEVRRFHGHPEWFHPDRHAIHLPKEAVLKAERLLKERWVILNPIGLSTVQPFLHARSVPVNQVWNMNLKRWARRAGIGDGGVSSKMTRKTWECWLAVGHPLRFPLIALNQGHTGLTAIEHYLNIPFTPEEAADIKVRTAGWLQD